MNGDKSMTPEKAVNLASWTHNNNMMVSGYTPMQLMARKSVIFPSISQGNHCMKMKWLEGLERCSESRNLEVIWRRQDV